MRGFSLISLLPGVQLEVLLLRVIVICSGLSLEQRLVLCMKIGNANFLGLLLVVADRRTSALCSTGICMGGYMFGRGGCNVLELGFGGKLCCP